MYSTHSQFFMSVQLLFWHFQQLSFFFRQEEVEMKDIAEEPIVDIDSPDKKNPLAVVEYIDDLYIYYKKVEVSI